MYLRGVPVTFDGWIETNPVQNYEKQGMKEILPDIVPPSEASIQKLSARAPGTLCHFPKFLDAAGGRVTEMATLLWSDISGFGNPVEGNVQVILRNTKGKKVRAIELRQEAIDILPKDSAIKRLSLCVLEFHGTRLLQGSVEPLLGIRTRNGVQRPSS